MIIRVIAIDPHPRAEESDVRVYQVPEKSREYELLTGFFDANNIEWTTIESRRHKLKVVK